jgi:hypothetical protein
MPIKVVNYYQWAGSVEVEIFTEHEMSTVLDLTVDELKSAIARGEYAYHAGPTSTGSGTPGKYQFTRRIYLENVEKKVARDRAKRERGQ